MNSTLQATRVCPQRERTGSRLKCLRASRLPAFITRGERQHARKFWNSLDIKHLIQLEPSAWSPGERMWMLILQDRKLQALTCCVCPAAGVCMRINFWVHTPLSPHYLSWSSQEHERVGNTIPLVKMRKRREVKWFLKVAARKWMPALC